MKSLHNPLSHAQSLFLFVCFALLLCRLVNYFSFCCIVHRAPSALTAQLMRAHDNYDKESKAHAAEVQDLQARLTDLVQEHEKCQAALAAERSRARQLEEALSATQGKLALTQEGLEAQLREALERGAAAVTELEAARETIAKTQGEMSRMQQLSEVQISVLTNQLKQHEEHEVRVTRHWHPGKRIEQRVALRRKVSPWR